MAATSKPKTFPVAVLTIGNEVLAGKTQDTNFYNLARGLTDAGAEVIWHASCRDITEEIAEALRTALRQAQLTVVTGGLGPTPDDLTRKVIAQVLERPLVLHDAALATLKARFASRGATMAAINEVQALLPQASLLIPNEKGSAPGFLVEHQKRHVLALPGVPWEMEAMLESFVLPWVRERTGGGRTSHLVLRTCGIAESALAEKLANFEQTLPEGATLAYLPQGSGVDLRVSFRGDTHTVEGQQSDVRARLIATVGEYIYSEGERPLEAVVGELLRFHKMTLALAESCTGGMIAQRITDVGGSSEYFDRGLVTYSNASKMKLLGVKASLLKKMGAVSEEVAVEMARGIRGKSGTTLGLGVTGIAGPTGGTPEKPVGLVYIAFDWGDTPYVRRYHFFGDRDLIRQRAATAALDILRRHLSGLPKG